eukprot:TRINITY_DN330_c0_g1_i4.p1 TRINITY_DN330_c0_g1~~TRINITY_DN330_c0_g1_i4.p1  ORF type:complete len:118 (-),score=40.35 TRINITY_DN330_c0_g1_i4:263-586(-)
MGEEIELDDLRQRRFDPASSLHQKVMGTTKPLPRRALALALFLLLVGVVFTISGLAVFLTQGLSESIPFWTLGGIGLIPGLYHTIIIYRAWRGYQGYTYDLVPSYQD